MPHSVASCGVIPGMAIIVFSGLLSFYGLYLLSRCASTVRPRRTASFAALSDMTYPKAGLLFDGAIAIKCAGVACSYLIIIGGLMPRVILSFDRHPPDWLLDRGLWIVAAMVILTPLCYLRQLNSLRFTSYVALVAVFDLVSIAPVQAVQPPACRAALQLEIRSTTSFNQVLVVVFKFFYRHSLPPSPPSHLFVLKPSIISSIPVYIFAFTCAQNLFSCFNELKDNTQRRMNAVTGTSIGCSALIYEVIGVLGYLTFGEKVPSNIMTAYHDSIFINICRAGIVILVLFRYVESDHSCRLLPAVVLTSPAGPCSYPLQILPCRASLSHLIKAPESSTKHIAITTFLLLLTFLISMGVSQLDLVLGIIGSTGSTTITFILPAIFYLKLFPVSKSTSSTTPLLADASQEDDIESDSATISDGDGDIEAEDDEDEDDLATMTSTKAREEDFPGARILAKCLLVIGFLVMFVCLGVVLYRAFSGSSDGGGH